MRGFIGILLAVSVSLCQASLDKDTDASAQRLPGAVSDNDFYDGGNADPARVELGRLLFFDKILSGNKNIACATCHHPNHGSSDGLALPLGEGPRGLGPERTPGASITEAVHERVPRNSPALFNLGAREFRRMFHDGRVEVDHNGFYASGFISPAKWKLPEGLDNVLAAQAMFPVTSPAEMAGQKGENSIADARALNNVAGPGGVWQQLSERLRAIPQYVTLFKRAFPEQVENAGDVSFVLAANAIAAFEASAFRADNSPFDRYLRGAQDSLDEQARLGMQLFYGKAGCAACHSGKFQTDHEFYAIAMPQIGPGKADGWDDSYWRATGLKAFPEDFGRARVTFREQDRYQFRTPSLRNVALTGPWGHAGAYRTLEDVVRHHLAPLESLEAYTPAADTLTPLASVLELTVNGSNLSYNWLDGVQLQGFLLRDTWVQRQPLLRTNIAQANELQARALSDHEVGSLLAFLDSLTDPGSQDLSHLVPARVPSGLPVAD